jgi:CDP-diacylglycerol--serine O-phosphatidyltransferase
MSKILKILKLKDYVTLIGTTCGLIALLCATFDDIGFLSLGFFLCSITLGTDLLDGYLARKMGTVNEMGKQLDSLSDSLTFGIAPSALTFQAFKTGGPFDIILGIGCICFALGAILRLARFNISESSGYTGVPTPLSGLFLINFFFANYFYVYAYNSTIVPFSSTIIITILLILFGWFNITTYINYGEKGKIIYIIFIVLAPFCPIFGIVGLVNSVLQNTILSLVISIFFIVVCLIEIVFILSGFFIKIKGKKK